MNLPAPSRLRPSLKEIQEIFPSATGVGVLLPDIGRGLVIRFNRCAHFFDEVGMAKPSKNVHCDPLFKLATEFGFMVLENCRADVLPLDNYSKLSSGKNSDGRFIQDPFHYDDVEGLGDFASCIYQQNCHGREEDTFYALESDVRDAIVKLSRDHLSDDVIDALAEMQKPSYRFRLYQDDDSITRQVIKHDYPDFVEDVFALIPEGRKYRKRWLKDKWDMTIDANIFGDIVHARPTGHFMTMNEPRDNPLRGLYIYRLSVLFFKMYNVSL